MVTRKSLEGEWGNEFLRGVVIATLTSDPAWIKSRTSSAHLYADIPPVIPSNMRLLVRLNMRSTEIVGLKLIS